MNNSAAQVRFVVMNNLFRTDLAIHRKYDLKGSTQGRYSGKAPGPDVILKDLDLDIKLSLEQPWHCRCGAVPPGDQTGLTGEIILDLLWHMLLRNVHMVRNLGVGQMVSVMLSQHQVTANVYGISRMEAVCDGWLGMQHSMEALDTCQYRATAQADGAAGGGLPAAGGAAGDGLQPAARGALPLGRRVHHPRCHRQGQFS